MEVYNHTDIPNLQNSQPNLRWSVLINADPTRVILGNGNINKEDRLFMTEQDIAREEMEKMLKDADTAAAATIRMQADEKDEDDEEFNLDDV